MKTIVLAEKPSVGRELARVLKCDKKTKSFCEGDNYIVTWAMGHLVELAEPGEYDEKFKKWDLQTLPMLPEKMKHKISYKDIKNLIGYDKNSRMHSDTQVQQIADSITEFGFTNPLLIDNKNQIIAGHGRLSAAIQLGMDKLPCVVLTGLTEDQKKAYVIADNQLALNAEWDMDMLTGELKELQVNEFNLELLGFDDEFLEDLLCDVSGFGVSPDEDSNYSRKIEAPIYLPTNDKPSVYELTDRTKTSELAESIRNSDLPIEEKEFLLSAAERHTVFDFSKIADYYAHSSPEVQTFMEYSALVIIDFDQAIENGFIVLSEQIMSQYGEDYAGVDEDEYEDELECEDG